MSDWYVVYTQPQAETRALGNLMRQGYRTYLPRARRWWRHARQRRIVSRPLFPRYLFVAVERGARWRPIGSTVGVVGLVRAGDRPLAVPTPLIDELRVGEAAGTFDQIDTARLLRSGNLVRVTAGPFADLIARFQTLDDAGRVTILLDLLGRAVTTTLPEDEVEPVI